MFSKIVKNEYAKTILLVVAAVILILIIFIYNRTNKSIEPNQSRLPVPSVLAGDLAANKLPDNFPKDIPLEKGAKVLQNYQKTSSDGSVQLVREFVTSKTIADNLQTYQDYMDNNGWKRSAGMIDQPKFKSFSATKDNVLLQVTIQENTSTRQIIVGIYVTFSTKLLN